MAAVPRDHILAIFREFAAVLDDQNDRKERLVKIARDITVLSKRVIFLLHRVPIHDHDLGSDGVDRRGVAGAKGSEDAYAKLESLKKLLHAMADQLQGQQVDRYSPTMSGVILDAFPTTSYSHFWEQISWSPGIHRSAVLRTLLAT